MTGIVALETRYAGCRFRSRLEARWAVFFDALGIRWEYEPQGYDLDALVRQAREKWTGDDGLEGWPWHHFKQHWEPGDGYAFELDDPPPLGWYLPDFWLPQPGIWFEVKGQDPPTVDYDRQDALKVGARYGLIPGRPVMYIGSIPDPRHVGLHGPSDDGYPDPYELSGVVPNDHHHTWTRCLWCGAYDVQFDARSARTYCGCHRDRGCHPDSPYGGIMLCDKCYNGADPTLLAAYRQARSARFEHGQTP